MHQEKKRCLNHSRFNSLTNKATLAFSQWESKQWFQTILFNLQAGLLGDKAFSFFSLPKKQTFLLFLRISFSKLCTFFRTTATRTQTFFEVCRCMSLHLLPQDKSTYTYALWKFEVVRNFDIILFTKTDFQTSSKPPHMYLNSTFFFLPQMKPFANISRTKVDDPKYNKLLHSDSLWSSRVFLNNLKSTYEEFKSSRLFKVFILSVPAFSPSPCICRLAEVYKSFKIIF